MNVRDVVAQRQHFFRRSFAMAARGLERLSRQFNGPDARPLAPALSAFLPDVPGNNTVPKDCKGLRSLVERPPTVRALPRITETMLRSVLTFQKPSVSTDMLLQALYLHLLIYLHAEFICFPDTH